MDLNLLIQASINGLLMGGVYALIAIGLTLTWGVMDIVNFAHGEFMMLSMYLSYWAFTLLGLNPYVSLLINIPLLFLLGALTQKVLIDRILQASVYIQIVLTLALALFLENMALYLWSSDYRTIKLAYLDTVVRFGDITIGVSKLIAFAGSIILAGVLYILLRKTSLGRAMRAVADDKEGAFLVGINVSRIYMLAFGVASATVGAAGALVIPFFYTFPGVGSVFVLMAFVVVVLGTMGNFIGALVGGLIIGFTESVAGFLLPGTLRHVVTFMVFILVLLFKPMGLFGRAKIG